MSSRLFLFAVDPCKFSWPVARTNLLDLNQLCKEVLEEIERKKKQASARRLLSTAQTQTCLIHYSMSGIDEQPLPFCLSGRSTPCALEADQSQEMERR